MFNFKDSDEEEASPQMTVSNEEKQLISGFKLPQNEEEEEPAKLFSKTEAPQASPVKGVGAFKLAFEDLNADFHVPETIFRKIKKLGKGAYGKVMQVAHLPSKKNYAMKRFEQVFSNDLRAKRLIRELSILKSVKHPCVNKLKCVIKPGNLATFDDVYLVIDQCDMDLKKLLKSSKYLSEEQVKSIVYDMLCGLNYLHKSQIIHRDLKPANILINDDCTIQICDFGLARSLKGVKTQLKRNSIVSENSSDRASQSTYESREVTPKGGEQLDGSCTNSSTSHGGAGTSESNSSQIILPSFEKCCTTLSQSELSQEGGDSAKEETKQIKIIEVEEQKVEVSAKPLPKPILKPQLVKSKGLSGAYIYVFSTISVPKRQLQKPKIKRTIGKILRILRNQKWRCQATQKHRKNAHSACSDKMVSRP